MGAPPSGSFDGGGEEDSGKKRRKKPHRRRPRRKSDGSKIKGNKSPKKKHRKRKQEVRVLPRAASTLAVAQGPAPERIMTAHRRRRSPKERFKRGVRRVEMALAFRRDLGDESDMVSVDTRREPGVTAGGRGRRSKTPSRRRSVTMRASEMDEMMSRRNNG